MPLNPLISLGTQTPDIGRTFSNVLTSLNQFEDLKQAPARQALLDAQVQGAQDALPTDQKKFNQADQNRLTSVVQGAFELNSIPQGQRLEAATQRRKQLIDAGLPTQDTDRFIAAMAAGDTAGAQSMLDKSIQLGTRLGIVDAPPSDGGFTLSEGQVRFGKNGIKIAEVTKAEDVDGPDFQQGTGALSGYSFNPSTGEFKLSGVAQQALKNEAEKTANKDGQLTSKDVASVNDKVTALTKGVIEIASAGKSLDALEKRATPAAKLAAVFKFMKAMDPSSTVRESEQGQVYAAEGVMKGFANQINAALGQGGLSEAGFRDLTNTAKSLANSAIESSQLNVTGYLDVLSDKITARDFNKLQARVPQKLELEEDIEGGSFNDDPLTSEEQAELERLEAQFGKP